MSDVVHRFYVLVFEDDKLFTLNIPDSLNVGQLRHEIRKSCKNGFLRGVDTNDLTVWKVSTLRPSAAPQNLKKKIQLKEPMALQPSDTLSVRIRSMGTFQKIAKKIEANEKVSGHLPHDISLDLVYIVVLAPRSLQKCEWPVLSMLLIINVSFRHSTTSSFHVSMAPSSSWGLTGLLDCSQEHILHVLEEAI